MAVPQFLPPGNLQLQLGEDDMETPRSTFQLLFTWAGILRRYSALVATVVNTQHTSTTVGRPTLTQLAVLPNGGIGYSLLDTTLGVPIWWNGAAWVNSVGGVV